MVSNPILYWNTGCYINIEQIMIILAYLVSSLGCELSSTIYIILGSLLFNTVQSISLL